MALRRCTGPIYVSEDVTRQLPKIRRLLRISGVPIERCVFLADHAGAPVHWVDRLLQFGSMTPSAYDAQRFPVAPECCWDAPRLSIRADDRKDRDTWLREQGIATRPIVLLQPGNKHAMKWGRARGDDSKAWSVAAWAELIAAVRSDLPTACILLCGSVGETPLLHEIRTAAHVSDVNVTTRGLPLRRLLALMEIAHCMISVDTGPSHMAAAAGCPLIVLYGAESRAKWGRRSPFGRPIIELGGPPDSRAVRDIPVDQVVTAWRNIARFSQVVPSGESECASF
jgi:heptosyltransferase-2/heptosyltransferase-3